MDAGALTSLNAHTASRRHSVGHLSAVNTGSLAMSRSLSTSIGYSNSRFCFST